MEAVLVMDDKQSQALFYCCRKSTKTIPKSTKSKSKQSQALFYSILLLQKIYKNYENSKIGWKKIYGSP